MAFTIVLTVIAYLLGTIPSSLIIGTYFYKIDVRKYGSKNPGATNTLRVLGNKAGFTVLILDMLKGIVATELARFLCSPDDPQFLHYKIIFGAAAIIGHILPIWSKFKGGKGVATLLGIIFSISPLAGLFFIIAFIIITSISHFVSLASIISMFLLPFFFYLILKQRDIFLMVFSFSTFLLTVITHRNNIHRLISGHENSFTFRKKGSRNE
jgi:acyl phosphate:glycerol-3-phosphate acyltransferase